VTHDWWSNWGYGQGGSENHPEGLTISFDQSQGKVVIDLNGVGYGESVTAYAYNGTTLVDTATTTWNNSSLELIDPNFSRTDAQTLITRVVLVGESGTSYTLDSVTTYGADTWTEQDLPPVTTYAAAPVTGFLQTNDYDVDTAGALSVALLDATGTWGDLTLDANMQYTYTPNIDAMNDSSTPPTDSFVETFTYEVTSPDGTTDIGTLLVPVNLNPSATVSLDSGTGIDNAFTGTNANEVIDGQTGSDTIHGGGGDDLIYGGEGNDILNGGGGDDIIFGGAGDDTINVSTGHDVIGLGEGKDVVQVDVSYLANNGGAEVTIADFSEKDGDVLDLNLDSGDTNSYILNFQEVLDDATATGSHYLELTVTDNNSATEDIVIKIMGAHIAHDAPTSGLTIDSNTIDDVIQQIIDSPDNT
jgi:VCBS repeat-containing protein